MVTRVWVSVWRRHENQFYNYNNYRLTSKKWKRRRRIEVGPGEIFLCAVEAQQRWCYKYFANVWHFCQSGRWIPTESGDLICGIESGGKIFKILRVRIRWSVYGAVKSEAPLWQLWQILNILHKIRALWQLWQSLQKSNFPWNKATLGQNSKKRSNVRTNILAKKRAIQSELAKSLREFVGEKHTQRWR